MLKSNKLPVSVLVMTQNEEANIEYALNSVINYFDEIVVCDSFSTDGTLLKLDKYNGIKIFQNKFISWADQRNWILQNCNIKNKYVFFLDADEFIEEDFYLELKKIIESKIEFSAIYLKIKFIFLNKWLKHAYGHPNIRRIFNKEGLKFLGDGAREYAITSHDLKEMTLNSYLIHHDKKPFDNWIIKHLNNSTREADAINKKEKISIDQLPYKLRIKIIIRNKLWNILPSIFKIFLYFNYRLIFGLGFVDGFKGFIYIFLHSFWYQLMIEVKIIERNIKNNE